MKKLLGSLLMCCMMLAIAPAVAAADKLDDVAIPQPQWASFADAESAEPTESGDSLMAVSYYEDSHVPTYYSLTGRGMIDSYFDEDLQTTGYVYKYYYYELNTYFNALKAYGFTQDYQEDLDGGALYIFQNTKTLGVCVIIVDYQYAELAIYAWDDPCLGGHTPYNPNRLEPTCFREGYTGDVICKYCNAILEEGKVIPKLPHTLEECGVKQEPTENSEGIMDNRCTVCGTHVETMIPAVGNPFVDVLSTEYYFKPVRWAVEQKIVFGMDETHFVPKGNCTRAQIVSMLWRLAGKPEPESDACPFTDVPQEQYYYKAVQWAVENKITAGVTETAFMPNRTCTRAEAVSFLWRFAGRKEAELSENPFEDVSEDVYYYGAVLWGLENKIVYGRTDTRFDPGAVCNRAEIVSFIYRYVQNRETADAKPDEDPEENPGENPDEKPDETPDENPDETPDENPDETPDENPDGNPDETPDENPGENPPEGEV
ncbi:MAG: S-layer homology domain-containing protein [Oscillospiraceae bacterium]|nr:S-layer homology domain-containing protein [Oscillospiraceae bacterium]